jgi:hypothetical protein
MSKARERDWIPTLASLGLLQRRSASNYRIFEPLTFLLVLRGVTDRLVFEPEFEFILFLRGMERSSS